MTSQQIAAGVLVVVAALAFRTALAERRHRGSGLAQWRFLSDAKAVVAGLIVFAGMTVGVLAIGIEPGAVLWAVLAGLLTSLIVYQLTHQGPRS